MLRRYLKQLNMYRIQVALGIAECSCQLQYEVEPWHFRVLSWKPSAELHRNVRSSTMSGEPGSIPDQPCGMWPGRLGKTVEATSFVALSTLHCLRRGLDCRSSRPMFDNPYLPAGLQWWATDPKHPPELRTRLQYCMGQKMAVPKMLLSILLAGQQDMDPMPGVFFQGPY